MESFLKQLLKKGQDEINTNNEINKELVVKKKRSSLIIDQNKSQEKQNQRRSKRTNIIPSSRQKSINKLQKKQKKNKNHIDLNHISLQKLIQQLKSTGQVEKKVLTSLIKKSSHIFENQPTLLPLKSPFIIVGDIHGQFYDLLHIFALFGYPPETKYLFLGDYVDRGKFCIEVMSLLLYLKIKYPKQIYMIRGNHEGRTMTSFFNFKTECEKKYSSDIYERFIQSFMKYPLCALIDDKYFAVHGGISPQAKNIKDIQKLNRFVEIPQNSPITDFLWSDPTDDSLENWVPNKLRACSYFYSRTQASNFLKQNKLKLIIRGHQVQMKGFKYQTTKKGDPLTLTVFSAPKYCDTYKNKGAVLSLKNDILSIKTFQNVEHPFILNNYLNVFELSLPIISSGITKLFTHMMKSRNKKSIQDSSEKQIIQQIGAIKQLQGIQAILDKNSFEVKNFLSFSSQNDNLEITQNEDQEALLQFINIKLNDMTERLPNIFGPKNVKFVKIKHKIDDQSQDFIQC